MSMEILWNGLVRRIHVLVSPGWRDDHDRFGPRPVLVMLHDEDHSITSEGAILPQSRPDLLEAEARMGSLVFGQVDGQILTHGRFVVVLPEGLTAAFVPPAPSDEDDEEDDDRGKVLQDAGGWDSGHRGRLVRELGTNDVGFLDQALHDLDERMAESLGGSARALALDRVFVAGLGNGGEMAYRLAGSHLRYLQIRGIAVVGGSSGGYSAFETAGVRNAGNPHGVPVLAIHGGGDVDVVPEVPIGQPIDALVLSRAKADLIDGLGADGGLLAPLSRSGHDSVVRWVGSQRSFSVETHDVQVDDALVDQTEWFDSFGVLIARYWQLRAQHVHEWPTMDRDGMHASREVWNFFASLL